MIFTEKYLSFETEIPTHQVYGLGERFSFFDLEPNNIFTIYNKDIPADIMLNSVELNNTYGYHPMYLSREKSSNFFLVFLRSSSPMDVHFKHDYNNNIYSLNFKIVGGILDLNFFFGDQNPENVISLYHQFIGGFSIPPFWAFGYHQCRWGYNNFNVFIVFFLNIFYLFLSIFQFSIKKEVEEVMASFEEDNIPIDSFWLDIDYMDSSNVFSINKKDFNPSRIKSFKNLTKKKLVVMIDSTISASPFLKNSNEIYFPLIEG